VTPLHGELRSWVEELALLYEREGLPRMAGRIFGWLLVCDPPEQTMEELGAALGGSKGSMSTMTRLLVQMGLVARARRPGERSDRFRIPPEHWDRLWRARLQSLSAAAALLGRGAALLRGRPATARRRIEDLHAHYRFFERELPRLLARLQAAAAERHQDVTASGLRPPVGSRTRPGRTPPRSRRA
jgi:DNA-binding MarR family transcriptional regulator